MAKQLNWLQVDRLIRQQGLTLFSLQDLRHLLGASELSVRFLLTRGKPRDYYDVYFLLRKGMITVDQRPRLAAVKQKHLRSKLNLQRELALFLPRSHHTVLRDFNRILETELTRHGA